MRIFVYVRVTDTYCDKNICDKNCLSTTQNGGMGLHNNLYVLY